MTNNQPIGLYIHIPFCLKKCAYCDFYSLCHTTKQQKQAYVDELCREIASYASKSLVADTVYIGGGTPTTLAKEQLLEIIATIKGAFSLSLDCEFSIEMNPATASFETLRALREAGVNRLSIGIQSLCDAELSLLGRIHTVSDATESVRIAREAGFENISLDVMYGIPSQSKASFEKTLEGILALKPEHISAYSLIFEEGTPFFAQKESFQLPSEDEEYEFYQILQTKLNNNGYCQYEISNYAKSNKRSRHNQKYWQLAPYIGCGPSAHSFFDGVRYQNAADLSLYLKGFEKSREIEEILTKSDFAYEYAILGLRIKDGISVSKYENFAGKPLSQSKRAFIDRICAQGYATFDGDTLAFTDKGLYVSSSILTELF